MCSLHNLTKGQKGLKINAWILPPLAETSWCVGLHGSVSEQGRNREDEDESANRLKAKKACVLEETFGGLFPNELRLANGEDVFAEPKGSKSTQITVQGGGWLEIEVEINNRE